MSVCDAENTRACYPINFIDNARIPCTGPHPRNIILLCCDAFGVLPPVSKLTQEQAMYHFISGYTAKVCAKPASCLCLCLSVYVSCLENVSCLSMVLSECTAHLCAQYAGPLSCSYVTSMHTDCSCTTLWDIVLSLLANSCQTLPCSHVITMVEEHHGNKTGAARRKADVMGVSVLYLKQHAHDSFKDSLVSGVIGA